MTNWRIPNSMGRPGPITVQWQQRLHDFPSFTEHITCVEVILLRQVALLLDLTWVDFPLICQTGVLKCALKLASPPLGRPTTNRESPKVQASNAFQVRFGGSYETPSEEVIELIQSLLYNGIIVFNVCQLVSEQTHPLCKISTYVKQKAQKRTFWIRITGNSMHFH